MLWCVHACMHLTPTPHHSANAAAPQARRLEELERLYRAEALARKRAHNALQDARGKIRVYCRVRPQLDWEAGKAAVR